MVAVSSPSNLPGHSEERCSRSRHACQNLAVFVIVDAIFEVGANLRVSGHLVFHSFDICEPVFSFEFWRQRGPRDSVTMETDRQTNLRMPVIEAWFTTCSRELPMTLLSGTQWVAVRLELVSVRSGIRSTKGQDWLRVSLALRSIELPLVFLEYPLRCSGREIHFVRRLALERGVGYMLVVLLDVEFDQFTYRSDGVERVQEQPLVF